MTKTIEWVDHGREPQCRPNPAFPNGRDLNCAYDIAPTCRVDLPYPAKRCGLYIVACEDCGMRIAITTAGRPDDPRSVTIMCHKQQKATTP